jgi:hypothetical protein
VVARATLATFSVPPTLHAEALRLASFAAEAQWRAVGGKRYLFDRPLHEQDLARAKTQLGADAFDREWTLGEALTTEQSIDLALDALRVFD